MSKSGASDIRLGNWVDRWFPARWRPFVRLGRFDRPIGIWLLMFPCWWGTALASPGLPDPWLLTLFLVGATAMRAAGCVLNDIADRDFDRRVARTRDRPLASGAVSLLQAMAMMAALLLIGLLVLLQFNAFTVWLGIASLALVAVYPFAKRITHWPQAVLGLAFNWGALVGWSAVRGDLDAAALALYAAGICWTLGYDTIYAHQDKDDDLMIGVKSTALRFGDRTRPWLAGFYGLAVLFLGIAGALAGLFWPFLLGLAGVAAHFFWQVMRADFDDPADCLMRFRSNQLAGLVVFLSIVAGRFGS